MGCDTQKHLHDLPPMEVNRYGDLQLLDKLQLQLIKDPTGKALTPGSAVTHASSWMEVRGSPQRSSQPPAQAKVLHSWPRVLLKVPQQDWSKDSCPRSLGLVI